MKQWFIGIVLLILGGGVLAVWGLGVRSRVGVDAWLAPSVVAGQLMAIGSCIVFLALGGAILWRAARFTALVRSGDVLHARAHPVIVVGTVLAGIGITAFGLGAAFGLVYGDGDAPLVVVAIGPVMLAFWALVAVGALAGRIWWPAMTVDGEWIVVCGFFERTTFRRAQVTVAADNGGTVVHGSPHRRDRSPVSVVLRYRGSTVMLPTVRLNPRALAAVNAPGVVRSGLADPRIVVPPR